MHRRTFIKASASVIAVPLAFVALTAVASIADDFTGADWNQWDSVRKHYYVWGFRSGQNSGATTALSAAAVPRGSKKWQAAEARIGISASVAQVVQGLDLVCSDYRNQSIPLWELTTYVLETIAGTANEANLDIIRRNYSSGPKEPKSSP